MQNRGGGHVTREDRIAKAKQLAAESSAGRAVEAVRSADQKYEDDLSAVLASARLLDEASESYLEDDFIMNLFETVLDYQMNTKAVVRALQCYQDTLWDDIRKISDLESVFTRFSDDKEGNIELAQHLWGYNLWTRAHQLRDLSRFFGSVGVTDQETLREWAGRSEFRLDFEGQVKGLGIAVYQWLVMRQGVDTVKPDVHVHRFAEGAVGRSLSDSEVIELVTAAAHRLGLKANELDWRIWEASRGGGLPYPTAPSSS
jgi:hypothetical protein